VLVVNDRILGPNSVISRLLKPEDISITNTTAIQAEVDGEAARRVTADEVRRLLSERSRRFLRLWLVNSRDEDNAAAAVDFRITIDIADPAALLVVDDAFRRHLARESVSRDDVRGFSDETDGLANQYRNGLASYFFGVFAKDGPAGPHDGQRLQNALDRFGAAAHYLEPYGDRRIGSAVAACARFNLNDFKSITVPTGVTEVDLVTRFLIDLSLGSGTTAFPERPTARPSDTRFHVDAATYSLLELVFQLAEASNRAPLDYHVDRIEHENLTDYDRAKLAVVVGERAYRDGQTQMGERCATTLYNDPVFGKAAERWRTS
jgi:hypothetical protein